MQGGTIFNFVTDGIESALEQARAAAADKVVSIAGGASTVQQYLAAGLFDELYLHMVPVILGAGERLLEDIGDPSEFVREGLGGGIIVDAPASGTIAPARQLVAVRTPTG